MSSRSTKLPGIPAPTDNNLQDVARAVKGILDVREGLSGNPLDANVTFRDLSDGGVINVVSAGGRVTSVTAAGSSGSGGYSPTEDFTPPPTPTGFTATGLFASVQMTWDALPSTYINHAYTEVWRSDTNVIGNAVLIGTSATRFYVDYLGNAVTRYYWIRYVSQADIKGAYNATGGTAATTAQNPGLLINSLSNAISTGQLETGLNGRINLIDGADTLTGSVAARIKTVETDKIGFCSLAGVATDHTTRATCQAAGGTWNAGLPLASAVKQVAISDGTTTAALEQRFTAQKTTNDGILAQYTVKVDVAGHVSGFGLASTLNTAAPFSEFGVRADRFWIAPPSVSSATAPTSNIYKGYVWRDTSVTPNVTRYYTGSAWTVTPQALPFIVQATPTTINGVSVPVGVYIDAAYIENGTITNAKIGNAAIDDAKIASLDAAKITTGTLDVTRLGANSITADRIRVTTKGGLTIISDDPMFGDPTLWSLTASAGFQSGDVTTGGKGGTFVSSSSGTNQMATSARKYEIDPTKVYRLSANLYRAPSSDRNMYIFLQFYNGAGVYIGDTGWGGSMSGYVFGSVPSPGGQWVRCGDSFGVGTARAIPAAARYCQIGVWFNYSGNGATTAEQRCQDLRLDEYINAGQLIVDGSITATQIDSKGLSIRDSAGNVILAAGSSVAGSNFLGNATGTINGVAASTISTAASNYNSSNDRNATAIVAPTIAVDGSAVDHTIQDNGSADLSFEWLWSGAEGDIDGFQIFVYQTNISSAYAFGTTPAAETVFEVPASKRAFIVYGVVPSLYYTFGVRAYRKVDKDIASSGTILSALVKPSLAAENPYQPSTSVVFAGNVTGTINGTAASTVTANASNGASAWGKFTGAGSTLPSGNVDFMFAGSTTKGGPSLNTDAVGTQSATTVQVATVNFNSRNDRIATAVVAPVLANNTNTLDHVINTDGSADISVEWTWAGAESDIDGFIVYVHDLGTTTPTVQRVIDGAANALESVYYVTPQRRAFILPGAAANHWYTFGVQAYRVVDADIDSSGTKKSAVVQPLSGATETTFGAYRPSSSVAFAGNVTGTINGTAASTVTTGASNGQTAYDAVNNGTTGLSSRLSRSVADTLSATISMSATAGAGFRAGSLEWDASGNRTAGSGVAMTPGGIVGHNGTKATFSINAATGDATFAGNLASATGVVVGGNITGWAWPPAGVGQSGFYLGPNGLLIGNANDNRYFYVNVNGDISAPGLSISAGSATFSGTLTANIVNTDQIVGGAAASGGSATSAGDSVSVTVSVPAGASAILVDYYLGPPTATYTGGGGKDGGGSYTYGPMATGLTDNGANAGTVIISPAAGNHTITLSRAYYAGTMRLGVLVLKR